MRLSKRFLDAVGKRVGSSELVFVAEALAEGASVTSASEGAARLPGNSPRKPIGLNGSLHLLGNCGIAWHMPIADEGSIYKVVLCGCLADRRPTMRAKSRIVGETVVAVLADHEQIIPPSLCCKSERERGLSHWAMRFAVVRTMSITLSGAWVFGNARERMRECGKRDMKVWAEIKNAVFRIRAWRERRREQRFPKAFPSDTYVMDLHAAAKTKKMWTQCLFAVVVVSALVDFYLLQDAFAWMLGTGSLADAASSVMGGEWDWSTLVGCFFTMLTCIALVVLYLSFGSIAGKKFAECRALKRTSSFIAFLSLFLAMAVILGFIAFVRYCSILDALDISSASSFSGGFGQGAVAVSGFGGGFGDASTDDSALSLGLKFSDRALVQTLGLVAVMFLGALLEVVHSYYSVDPYAAEKKRLAESHIPEDRRLYERTYASYAVEPDKSYEYEERERELDRRAVDSAFRISELVTQLNGIVDPADAYDFCAIGRMIRESQGRESTRGECK